MADALLRRADLTNAGSGRGDAGRAGCWSDAGGCLPPGPACGQAPPEDIWTRMNGAAGQKS